MLMTCRLIGVLGGLSVHAHDFTVQCHAVSIPVWEQGHM